MGILAGKKILVTGVLTDASIAFHIARLAQEEGATVILSSYGRVMSLTTRIAGRLPQPARRDAIIACSSCAADYGIIQRH